NPFASPAKLNRVGIPYRHIARVDWFGEHIAEFTSRAEHPRTSKRNHTVVLPDIVLNWIASQDNAALGLQATEQTCGLCPHATQPVPLVEHDEHWAGRDERGVHVALPI